MVPKGWKAVCLDDVSSKIAVGLAISVTPFMRETGVKLIRNQNIKRNKFNPESIAYLDNDFALENKSKMVRAGDIIAVRTGSNIGEACVVPPEFDGALTFTTLIVRPVKEKLSAYFLATHMNSIQGVSEVIRLMAGGGKPNLNSGELKNYQLLLPPLPEQRKIAQILSTWDKAIATTERLLANKQQQKKALMQRLLTGKQRFAGFEGEWQIVKLGSVAEMNSGGTPKSTIEDYYGGQIPWVSIADMTSKGKWIDSTDKYLTQMGLDNSSARIYPVNTVLYAMYASIGECSIAKVELTSSQAILGIRPSAQLHFEFLYFYLCSLKDKIKLQGQQGTQANLNAGMVKEFLIPLPSINEQRQIASVLCLADNELAIIQLQLENLKQQKKALMQQLLTGKRRVKVDEVAA